MKTHCKKNVLALALAALAQSALAQQPPSAGSQLQSIPSQPTAPRAAPAFMIEPRPAAGAGVASPASDQVRIAVKSLRITGAQRFSEAELLTITGFTPGSELMLSDLQQMADRITAYYRRNGYFVAQAFLPAQNIVDNTVTIAVTEGRYGSVTLDNQAGLPGAWSAHALDGVRSGEPITSEPLETRLLLLSDLPGVNVRSSLVPGTAPGTSDLLVNVTPGRRVSGSVDADNGGSRYTGEYRLGATINLNNPLGLGDVASLRLLTSGSGLNYARASYQLQVGKGQVGVAYSALNYKLGREFAPLQAHGTSRVASVFGRYPLLRSRDDNVYAQIEYGAKTFQDRVDSIPAVTDKQAGVVLASLYGDHRDTLGGLGLNAWSLSLSSGNIDIQTPAARAADAATARSNGHFNKLGFSAMRLQTLGGPFSAYGSISGQVASKNLDVSEKMSLGGMNAVRAYPEGEAYADEGVVVTLEGRMLLTGLSQRVPGQVQLVAFVDAGTAIRDKNQWAPGVNRRTLYGAGVGLNWSEPGDFLVRVSYARRLGSEPATSAPDKSGRFWIQGIKYF
ncbi:MAG: ShlB/FhaC/HecB family hemolysin secretion/activation protein [Bdellovibrionales bacterium]|nr:ShlB/FhaC/HecB family hemolysin secretion/activation protein [Ramlibacter sp.]